MNHNNNDNMSVAQSRASRSLRIERLGFVPEDILPHYISYGFGACIAKGDYVRAMLIAEKERELTITKFSPVTCNAEFVRAIRGSIENGAFITIVKSSTLDHCHHRIFGRSTLSPVVQRLSLQAPEEPADNIPSFRWLKRLVSVFDKSRHGVALTCAEELHQFLPIAKSPKDLLLLLLSLYRSLVRLDDTNISSKLYALARLIGHACSGSMPPRHVYTKPGFVFSGPPGIGKSHFVCMTDYGLIDAEWLAPSHRRDELVYKRLTRAGFSIVSDQYTFDFEHSYVFAMFPHDLETCLRRANIHPAHITESEVPTHSRPFRPALERYMEGFYEVRRRADGTFTGNTFMECYAKFLLWQEANCLPPRLRREEERDA